MSRPDAPDPPEPPAARRVLFLDDDFQRAAVFLERYPEAVWVETVVDCLARLAEPWDEVHLDHDLGGEIYVDLGRDDCGMAVVRWLCLEPRPHLKPTQFYVHSHNAGAAGMMVMQMQVAGFRVEARPFGMFPPSPSPSSEPDPLASGRTVNRGWFRSALDYLAGRGPRPGPEPEPGPE